MENITIDGYAGSGGHILIDSATNCRILVNSILFQNSNADVSGSYFGDISGSSVLIENVVTKTTHSFTGGLVVSSCSNCNINITNVTTEAGSVGSVAIGSTSNSRVYYSNFSLSINSQTEGTISSSPNIFKVDGWFNCSGTKPKCTAKPGKGDWL